jgi:Tol biopolymer transport system component
MAQAFDAGRLALHGEPIRVADSLAFNPATGRAAVAVSDTGTLVYRHGTAFERSQLNWYDRSGKPLNALREPGLYRGVALSPDNTRAAVHQHEEPGGGDVWVQDLSRGTFTKLTFNAHNFAPAWSHDGAHIYFTSDRDGVMTIYRISSSGAGGVERILTPQGFYEDAAPDGQWILYGGAGAGIDIWLLPLKGERKPKVLVSTNFFDGFSKFSPNGRWIAYESDESGSRQVYVQPFPEQSGKWQISTTGGRYVRWARNGRELFYLTEDGMMMTVDVQPEGSAFRAGTPRPLFKTNPVLGNHRGSTLDIPYDVSRDGQRFLVNERVGTTQNTPITVVLHWTGSIGK